MDQSYHTNWGPFLYLLHSCLGTRTFHACQYFDPCDLDLDLKPASIWRASLSSGNSCSIYAQKSTGVHVHLFWYSNQSLYSETSEYRSPRKPESSKYRTFRPVPNFSLLILTTVKSQKTGNSEFRIPNDFFGKFSFYALKNNLGKPSIHCLSHPGNVLW